MRYECPLIAVSDIEYSKEWYRKVLGLKVTSDLGANVTLTGGIALQTLESWKKFIGTDDVTLHNNAGELYFEEDDIDAFCQRISSMDITYVHELFEHKWGQRVVRFYDPDWHIIEVGENMKVVARRFAANGMSAEDVAERMGIPLSYARSLLKQKDM